LSSSRDDVLKPGSQPAQGKHMAVQGGAGLVDRRLLHLAAGFPAYCMAFAGPGRLAALPVAGAGLIPPVGSRAGLGWLAAGP